MTEISLKLIFDFRLSLHFNMLPLAVLFTTKVLAYLIYLNAGFYFIKPEQARWGIIIKDNPE